MTNEEYEKKISQLENTTDRLENEMTDLKESIDAMLENIIKMEEFLIPNKYRKSSLFPGNIGDHVNFYETHRRIGVPHEPYSKEKGEASLKRMMSFYSTT